MMTRRLVLFLTISVFFVGCLALESTQEGGIQCSGDQAYDPLSRTCQGVSVPEGVPTLTLQQSQY